MWRDLSPSHQLRTARETTRPAGRSDRLFRSHLHSHCRRRGCDHAASPHAFAQHGPAVDAALACPAHGAHTAIAPAALTAPLPPEHWMRPSPLQQKAGPSSLRPYPLPRPWANTSAGPSSRAAPQKVHWVNQELENPVNGSYRLVCRAEGTLLSAGSRTGNKSCGGPAGRVRSPGEAFDPGKAAWPRRVSSSDSASTRTAS